MASRRVVTRSEEATALQRREAIDESDDPVMQHATYFAESISALKRYAVAARKIVLIVGTSTVDEKILLSYPPKHDWMDFYPFGLLDLWRAAELRICARHFVGGAPLAYLDAGGVGRIYAGVRCDGMHFSSDYKRYGCSASPAVWDVYLLQALERVGVLERADRHRLWLQSGEGSRAKGVAATVSAETSHGPSLQAF